MVCTAQPLHRWHIIIFFLHFFSMYTRGPLRCSQGCHVSQRRSGLAWGIQLLRGAAPERSIIKAYFYRSTHPILLETVYAS